MTALSVGARLRADAQRLFHGSQQFLTPYSASDAWRAIVDIFQHCMRMDVAARILAESEEESAFNLDQYQSALTRLLAGEPIAYVLGEAWFFGRKFEVNSNVLIPRPDTELLVEVGLEAVAATKSPRVLDVGTGSGCIAISIALVREDAQIVAADISETALAVARSNAQRLRAKNIEFVVSDGYSGVVGQRFDLIVSNPPYLASNDPHLPSLAFEPQNALIAGTEGLEMLRTLVSEASIHLCPGATLAVEHAFDQSDRVYQLFEIAGFNHLRRHRDGGQHLRAISGRAVAA